jgi:hypothetical protein
LVAAAVSFDVCNAADLVGSLRRRAAAGLAASTQQASRRRSTPRLWDVM